MKNGKASKTMEKEFNMAPTGCSKCVWGEMRKAILSLLLAVASSNAAAGWIVVSWSDTTIDYIDPTSIRRVGDRVKMWHLIDLKTAESKIRGVSPFMSSRAQHEYDCKEEQSRVLFVSFHSKNMAEGITVSRNSYPESNWSPVPPGTTTEALWKIACEKSYAPADDYQAVRDCVIDGDRFIKIFEDAEKATPSLGGRLLDDSKIAAIREAEAECAKRTPEEKAALMHKWHLKLSEKYGAPTQQQAPQSQRPPANTGSYDHYFSPGGMFNPIQVEVR
ncbi:MAG: hypothetical protein A3H31_10940 [Gallionellales bacterium RIFCSPLOWO2_02_FULL_57_47]|nr:MAG: hypothetical protein A3H31_10940 [Gallionellales bacterium RIFCSPLOWO2_02_FULL_57_47]OGT15373.1 MAG: hypothetical protein A3J49_10200 [Gallionellales bacterium RIFCSPHIGHO2_02_FULL_57_16]